ncbi:putative E3 ubiquitin-protein ligase SRFP1 [Blattamonas nauphoetae]|uniref:E3 ubiquitin-protein ligase SRFP1 n=1 Tax=Blattamonas nauphoetae TaxID=2049346 RepID=A0ABQ9YFW3_9EUKA|nr:putative E3 ubiquitin-protein ligase SRFP1 [Blattamonas nauphoetae]
MTRVSSEAELQSSTERKYFPEGRCPITFEFDASKEFTVSAVALEFKQEDETIITKNKLVEFQIDLLKTPQEGELGITQQSHTTPTEDREEFQRLNASVFYGCKHYLRGCKYQCNECQRFFPCRICHDKIADHEMDRKAVSTVWCYSCDQIGPIGQNCTNCGVEFAPYYCQECHLLSGTPFKSIYHCQKCGVCRNGKENEVFHCDSCNCCFYLNTKDTHQCKANALNTNCPVCFDELFLSRKQIVQCPCGHFMHLKCKNALFKGKFFDCPLCHQPLIHESQIDPKLKLLLEKKEDGQ